MIVTVDGPAGAGKSSVARALAKRLGFRFLDTGAMYRAVALAGRRDGVDFHDARRLAELAAGLAIEITDDRVFLNGEDVTGEIRTNEITLLVRAVADNVEVRRLLVDLQRRLVGNANVITEGRDQGTVAFPDAQCKVFLTATPEERARRRLRELRQRGESAPFEVVLDQQNQRDRQDAARPLGGLIAAPDAVEVATDGLTQQQVVDRLEKLVLERQLGDRLDS